MKYQMHCILEHVYLLLLVLNILISLWILVCLIVTHRHLLLMYSEENPPGFLMLPFHTELSKSYK